MVKRAAKNLAIELRSQGMSYREILLQVQADGHQVSQGSLSNWLKDVELTSAQKKRLLQNEEAGKAKGRQKIIEAKKIAKEAKKKKLIEGGWM